MCVHYPTISVCVFRVLGYGNRISNYCQELYPNGGNPGICLSLFFTFFYAFLFDISMPKVFFFLLPFVVLVAEDESVFFFFQFSVNSFFFFGLCLCFG